MYGFIKSSVFRMNTLKEGWSKRILYDKKKRPNKWDAYVSFKK